MKLDYLEGKPEENMQIPHRKAPSQTAIARNKSILYSLSFGSALKLQFWKTNADRKLTIIKVSILFLCFRVIPLFVTYEYQAGDTDVRAD